jgi:hypothetical protein
MATGYLTPDARLRVLSDLGVILPGAKLNTYSAGTSTPLATYSDVALTTPNANPVVASSGGLFGPIFLTRGVAYKFVLTDTLGNAVWTQDNVTVPGSSVAEGGTGAATFTAHGVLIGEGTSAIAVTGTGTIGQVLTSKGAAADPTFQASAYVNDFRLTLTTGLPVTSADVLAATSVFWTPMTGNRCTVFDSAGNPTTLTSAELSIALPAVANQMYDIFDYSNAGVLALELLAWTNDTTRATAIVLTTTGSYTKSGDLTRRYLGTVRTTAVAGQTEDSVLKRHLSNYYHDVDRPLLAQETAGSWTHSIATVRQVNANVLMQVAVVVGVAGVPVELEAKTTWANPATTYVQIGVGEDSITVLSTKNVGGLCGNGAGSAALYVGMTATFVSTPAAGYHYFAQLEGAAAVATTTFQGANASFIAASRFTGMAGTTRG